MRIALDLHSQGGGLEGGRRVEKGGGGRGGGEGEGDRLS